MSLLGVGARFRLIDSGALLRDRLLPIANVVVVVVDCGRDVVVVNVMAGGSVWFDMSAGQPGSLLVAFLSRTDRIALSEDLEDSAQKHTRVIQLPTAFFLYRM